MAKKLAWTGEIVYEPPGGPHECALPHGQAGFRPGTVWRCDCDRTWVNSDAIHAHWRPEPRFARWRRERRMRRAKPSPLRFDELDVQDVSNALSDRGAPNRRASEA